VCAEAILIFAIHIGVDSLDFSFLFECGLQLPLPLGLPLGQISVLLRRADFLQFFLFPSLSCVIPGTSRKKSRDGDVFPSRCWLCGRGSCKPRV
jgi:hypothetical protein